MPALTEADRSSLLRLARRSLTQYTESKEIPSTGKFSESLRLRLGVFVTLRRGETLRGCIGFATGIKPLAEAVVHCVIAAGHEDLRFDPVEVTELDDIHIEISVLGEPQLVRDISEIEVGKHGLIVEKAARRGLLLPQVAVEHGFDAARFLDEVCVKAGLDRGAWQDRTARLSRFTAEVFCEKRGR
ncbi:MAG: AmmeMemoRadiSam system protein A [Acidobacteriota bacterium]